MRKVWPKKEKRKKKKEKKKKKKRVQTMDVICGCDVDSDCLAEVVFVHCKVTLPSCLHSSTLFGRKSLYAAHSSGVRSYIPPPWWWSVHIELFGILLHEVFVSSPHIFFFFAHLFISVWTHRYSYYTLGYNLMPLYFLGQIVAGLASRSSFSWLLCPFDIPLS